MTAADPFLDDGGGEHEAVEPWWHGLISHLGWAERAFNRARASGRAEDDTRLRLFFIMALFAAAFCALAIGATNAALFARGAPRRAGVTATRAERGDLVDRNGEVLATDIARYGLYLRPAEVADKAGTEAAIRAIAPMIPRVQLENALAGRENGRPAKTAPTHTGLLASIVAALSGHKADKADALNPTKEFFVADGLTPAVKEALHDLALPGLDFQEESGRYYPQGQTGAHVIGYASKDGHGLAGAEKAFDAPVRADGGRASQALSIDLRVQAALQDEVEAAAVHFGVKDAVGIVVNVRTGEILAMTSYPAFSPNTPGSADPAMVNHAAATVYEPGSVFKVFTVAMGLDTGLVQPTTVFNVCEPLVLPGQIIHDYDKGDCTLPLWEVFTHSSNIGAAKMAIRVGGDHEEAYFRDFGLFQRAPSELAESARPLTPQRISVNAVATMAFGQSISVSPLAIATGMSAILDGGVYRPLTLKKLEPGQAPAPGRRVIKESTSRTMLHLMRLNATNGTGRFADQLAPGYMVGGKTGTATKLVHGHYDKGKKNLASFAAIFPTTGDFDQDRYYVLVMMDEPNVLAETGGFTTGGAVSAPIAGRIIRRIAPFLNAPRISTPPDAPAPGSGKDDVDPAIIRALDR